MGHDHHEVAHFASPLLLEHPKHHPVILLFIPMPSFTLLSAYPRCTSVTFFSFLFRLPAIRC